MASKRYSLYIDQDLLNSIDDIIKKKYPNKSRNGFMVELITRGINKETLHERMGISPEPVK